MSLSARLFCLLLLLAGCLSQVQEKKWWETANFYQIYPRSYQDSDNDGIGDLKGIMQRLPYLKEIGVTATWLSPIYASPMADFGYDISDFYKVDPIFGTNDDFDELTAEANRLGLRIIMDLVPNHSSDECEWFEKSVARIDPYTDYYVWHPGKIVNGVRQAPSNWISVFGGSMWQWNEQRQEYYLHQFHRKQPDLNYRNPEVHELMKEVIRFWVRKGVRGFRVDAVPHIYEIEADANGNYIDNPENSDIYTKSRPETVSVMYEFREVLLELEEELGTEELILMVEAYESKEILFKYFGNETVKGAQIPFNFAPLSDIKSYSNAGDYKKALEVFLTDLPEGRVANWVMGNHDNNRVASRLGEQRIDVINMMVNLLPGCAITYQGEEIGMTDGEVTWDEGLDPQACQATEEQFASKSRDPERTPMHWNDELYAGFSNATPWLPVASNYKLVNVKNNRVSPRSHLNVYKQLKNLRKLRTFSHGDVQIEAINDNVLAFKRSLTGYPTYVVLLNINNEVERLNVTQIFSDVTGELQYEIVTDRCSRRSRESVNADNVLLMPYEGSVLRALS